MIVVRALFLLLRETARLLITGHGFNREINAAVLTLQPDLSIWPETNSRHVALIHGTSLKTFRQVLIISIYYTAINEKVASFNDCFGKHTGYEVCMFHR